MSEHSTERVRNILEALKIILEQDERIRELEFSSVEKDKRIAKLEAENANARGLVAEMLALNPIVSGDMEKVHVWAGVLSRLRQFAKADEET